MQPEPSLVVDPVTTDSAWTAIHRRGRRYGMSLLAIASLAVGYILSPGPILMMTRNRPLPPAVETAIGIFFAPLAWAMMRFPIVENFYKRYFELMGVDL